MLNTISNDKICGAHGIAHIVKAHVALAGRPWFQTPEVDVQGGGFFHRCYA